MTCQYASKCGDIGTAVHTHTLPFTGFGVVMSVLVALLVIIAGVLMRRAA
jgi:hypothetical protein